jgi:hypothetical protein
VSELPVHLRQPRYVLFPGRCFENSWRTHEPRVPIPGVPVLRVFELPKQSGLSLVAPWHMHHGSSLIPVTGASNLAALLGHLFLPMVTFIPYLVPPDDCRDR